MPVSQDNPVFIMTGPESLVYLGCTEAEQDTGVTEQGRAVVSAICFSPLTSCSHLLNLVS